MFKKKIISIILSVALTMGCMSIPSRTAQAAPEPEAVMTDTEADVSVSAADSFGSMLAEQMDEETNSQEGNQGCNIFSIEMNGENASVSFETVKDAVLIVGIYDESGVQMLASGTSKVAAGDTSAAVTIETEQVPQYFYVRGFLVDEETYKPYCTSYESPNYTKEMQEFLAKTAEDFTGREVLNFDENQDNNFAVYNEDTVVVPETDGTNEVTKADTQTQTYIIEHADASVTSLQEGDIFSYEYEDGTVLIVKVASVKMDGTTATITGTDTAMEEVFDYVKIDAEEMTEHATVDDASCEDGITYNGLVDNSASGELQTQGIDIDISSRKSASLSLDKKISNSVKLSGGLQLKVENSLKFYVSLSYQYLELKIDYSAKLSASITGKMEKTAFSLATFRFTPVTGVLVEITPSLVAEVTAKTELNGQLNGTIGFSVSSDAGLKNLTKSPSFKPELKGEITVFVGLSMKPKLNIISDHLASVEVGAVAGVEASGTKNAIKGSSSTLKHECTNCIDGDIMAKLELSFRVKLLNWDKLTWKYESAFSVKLLAFYWSADYGEFGFTTCPHITYKTTVKVKDSAGNPVKDAAVNETYITDENGITSFYLPDGNHVITVFKTNTGSDKRKIQIHDSAKSIVVKLKGGSGSEVIKMKNISLGASHSGAVKEDGSLWMWGVNRSGELGDGTRNVRQTPVKIMDQVKAISLGGSHSSAVKADGSLWMWGSNYFGELGDGTKNARQTPVKIMDHVKTVSLGYYHSGAIKEDGSLWMWGMNVEGQLGDGTRTDRQTPVKIMDHVKAVSLGAAHSCAVKEDGSLWMWGSNYAGALGDGTMKDRQTPVKIMDNVKAVSLGDSHSSAVKEDGSLWIWGQNDSGQLGDGTANDRNTPVKLMTNVNMVSLGTIHNGVIKKDGSLWMWGGDNYHGQLGDGTTNSKQTPVKIMDHVKTVSLGGYHSGAVKEDGSLWMWGQNIEGQLGTGNLLDSSHPQNITQRFGGQKADNLQTEIITSADNDSFTFSGLIPNAIYNFYCMKSNDAENPFSADNLLYLTQTSAAEDGSINITYTPKEVTAGVDEFVVCMNGLPIESADIKIPNLKYTGKEQFLTPTVTYQGKTLEEGIDYELSGDYSAIESGTYKVSITGIGDYDGTITKTWQMTKQLPFTDVHSGDWFEGAVAYVYSNRIMTGLTPDTFGPAQNLSRAQFATILYRMNNSPEVSYSERFPDVLDNQFYTKPVLWASKDDVKVVNGYADGYFGPNDNITREQMAVMMYRYASYKGHDTSARGDLSGFPDQASVSSFSRDAMEWAVVSGLISGNADQTLAPQGNASRAVCATIIMRFIENIAE